MSRTVIVALAAVVVAVLAFIAINAMSEGDVAEMDPTPQVEVDEDAAVVEAGETAPTVATPAEDVQNEALNNTSDPLETQAEQAAENAEDTVEEAGAAIAEGAEDAAEGAAALAEETGEAVEAAAEEVATETEEAAEATEQAVEGAATEAEEAAEATEQAVEESAAEAAEVTTREVEIQPIDEDAAATPEADATTDTESAATEEAAATGETTEAASTDAVEVPQDGAALAELLTPETFDADAIVAYVEQSDLDAVAKDGLLTAIEQAREQPAFVDAAILSLKRRFEIE